MDGLTNEAQRRMEQKVNLQDFQGQATSEDVKQNGQDGEAELRKWKILRDLPHFLLRETKYAAVARRLETNFQGWYGYALLVTKDDSVYVIGDNRCGQLGLAKHLSHFAGPTKVESLCGLQIVGFATSWNNVACWTKDGKLFMMGHNREGQLGLGHAEEVVGPKQVMKLMPEEVIKASCGRLHTLCLTASGHVYSWGVLSVYNQLINSDRKNIGVIPLRVVFPIIGTKIIDIGCGAYTSYALTADGKLYAWGRNKGGQAGVGQDSPIVENPVEVKFPDDELIIEMACGYSHCLALTNERTLYAWGTNLYGEVGTGTKTVVWEPFRLNLDQVDTIATSNALSTSACKTSDGMVWIWGRSAQSLEPIESPYGDEEGFFATKDLGLCETMMVASHGTPSGKRFGATGILASLPTNISFVVEGHVLQVPKSALERCEVCCEKIITEWGSKLQRNGIIEVTEFSYEAFVVFIRFLQTDVLSVEAADMIELLHLAQFFKMPKFHRSVIAEAKGRITVESALKYYAHAIRLDDSALGLLVANFATQHLSEVLDKTDLEKVNSVVLKKLIQDVKAFGAFDIRSKMRHS